MPTLHFKGKPLLQTHHLVVPFSALEVVKSRGPSKTPDVHDNLIVEGDNLKASKALLPTWSFMENGAQQYTTALEILSSIPSKWWWR
jgi:hypothetical protein